MFFSFFPGGVLCETLCAPMYAQPAYGDAPSCYSSPWYVPYGGDAGVVSLSPLSMGAAMGSSSRAQSSPRISTGTVRRSSSSA